MCMQVCTHARTSSFIHEEIDTYTYMHRYLHTENTSTCILAHIHTCIIVAYMHAWMCIYIDTYTYIHTYSDGALTFYEPCWGGEFTHIQTYIHTYIHTYSDDAFTFYERCWGGEFIHVGLYDKLDQNVEVCILLCSVCVCVCARVCVCV
jgi:hypothetical protein